MSQFIFYFITMVTVGLLSNISLAAEERDQFSYDAQLLEKMIRMEIKMEQMQEEMKETQTHVTSILEKVSRVLDNKTAEINGVLDNKTAEVNRVLDNKTAEINGVLNNKTAEVNRVLDIKTAEINGVLNNKTAEVNRVLDNKTAELQLLQDKVDMPMVAFYAYKPLDLSLNTNQILILQNVSLNKGNGYDNVLGIFTAPVTGLYYFTVHTCNYAGRAVQYHIVLEHEPIARSTNHNTVTHDCGSASTITMVTAGQRVWIKCSAGYISPQFYENIYRQTSFSGVLLQK